MLTCGIRQINKKLCGNVLLPSQLCEACIDQAEHIKKLNAFISLTKATARLQAKEADHRLQEGQSRGLLDGIPIAVKDNFCTRAVQTTCASRMLQHFHPNYDATVVCRLLDAGAVLLGKCNMDEFAMGCGSVDSLYGPVKNVWQSQYDMWAHGKDEDPDWYIAGGSSGGSAVAVASGTVFAALGSDTGGSTRNPAAYCGVVGLKPSYGLLSRHGLIPLVNSMDVPGILTRTVDDCVAVLNVLATRDPLDSTTVDGDIIPMQLREEPNVTGLRVGIPVEYHCPGLTADVLKVWTRVANMLEEAGAIVSQVSLPHTGLSIACYSVLNQCEVASNMARYDGIEFGLRPPKHDSVEDLFAAARSQGFGPVVRSRILAGNYFLLTRNYTRYFQQALKLRRRIADDFSRAWMAVDVLLTPVTLSSAPRFSTFTALDNRQQCSEQDFCTQPANLAGCPAVSIPIELSEEGLPISLQLMASNYREDVLLNTAKWIQNTVQFPCLQIK